MAHHQSFFRQLNEIINQIHFFFFSPHAVSYSSDIAKHRRISIVDWTVRNLSIAERSWHSDDLILKSPLNT